MGPLQTLGPGFTSHQCLVERLESLGGVWYEAMVEVHHADEPLERFDVDRLGVVLDGFDLGRKWSDSILVDPVAQEIDFGYTELAFFGLDD